MSPDIELSYATSDTETARQAPTAPFRVLVLADLAAAGISAPLSQRPVLPVDIDNLEQQMARIAPRLQLPITGIDAIEFTSLDDFHPDRLCHDQPALARLLRLRERLQNPAQVASAIAELSHSAPVDTSSSAAPEQPASPFEQLLGGRPTPSRRATVSANLERLLADIVQPHVVKSGNAQPYLQAVDTTLTDALRPLLHDPAFQALEADWRGLTWLLAQLPDDPALQIHCIAASKAELADDLLAENQSLDQSMLYRRLRGLSSGAPDDLPWTLVVALYEFSGATDSIRLLAALGGVSVAVGASLVTAAAPSLAGCNDRTLLAEPDQWRALEPATDQRWRALRGSTIASRIALLLPRMLLRLPYGTGGEAIDSFPFQELANGPSPGELLWANPSLTATLALVQGFLQHGWALDPATPFDLDDIPAYTYSVAGAAQLQPGSEVLLSERAATALTAQGFTPLLSYRNRNTIRLPGCFAINGGTLTVG